MKEDNPYNLPEPAITSLKEYVRIGRPVGSFLEAVLSNDLMDAFGKADSDNRHILFEYTCHVYNELPWNCHGSREIYERWVVSGGLEGQRKKKTDEEANNV